MYSSQGEPLPWSSRTRTLKYKYDKSTPNSKKKLSKHIEKNMLSVVNEKVGVLPENIELDVENLNQEREKRLLSIISKEVLTYNKIRYHPNVKKAGRILKLRKRKLN